MEYTKEQRREIYLKTAEAIENNIWWCICGTFKKLEFIGSYPITTGITNHCKSIFPEFELFDPENGGVVWFGWEEAHDSKANRINALLLMAEMCND